MTIREIAQIADVSPATVSKIINGKHENISDETRERVLRVVKEYNYAPYANALASSTSKSFLIGVLLRDGDRNRDMFDALIRQAGKDGYGAITCVNGSVEDERKNISMLLAHRVDGVLWHQVAPAGSDAERALSQQGVPYYTINPALPPSEKNLCMDYQSAGYLTAEALANAKHQRICCLYPKGGMDVEAFLKGFEQCLYNRHIPASMAQQILWQPGTTDFDSLLLNCTGFVCFDTFIASDLVDQAKRRNIRIPRDISIVSLDHGSGCAPDGISLLSMPYASFGTHCARMLKAAMEDNKAETVFAEPMRVEGCGIDVPITVRGKKIVVVGALNIDTVINIGRSTRASETLAAKGHAMMPGGRGVNQAIGAAKLGAEVYLIGRRGADYEGNTLMEALLLQQIDVSCVKTDPHLATGRAYIHVRETGESNIVVYDGANQNLTPADIEQAANTFENASFCLLQTDMRVDTVKRAAQLAKAQGAMTLLKPAMLHNSKIDDELLQLTDILQPNREELEWLYPGDASLEQKAQSFLDRGVGAVIVTLNKRGCYLRTATISRYFPAAGFQPVDESGAADAFSATLAAYLNEGKELEAAICYAICAAGFAITRQGVSAALVDKSTLELYMSQHFPAESGTET